MTNLSDNIVCPKICTDFFVLFFFFFDRYTSNELRYLPVNTVIYGPVRHPSAAKDVDGSQTDSDDSSSSDESR